MNLMKDKFREEGEYRKTLPEPFPKEYSNELFVKEDDRCFKEMPEDKKNDLDEVGKKYWNMYKYRGLSSAEVKKRQELYGKNKRPEKKALSWVIQLLKQWTSLFAILLWSASVLSFVVYAMDPSTSSYVYYFNLAFPCYNNSLCYDNKWTIHFLSYY
jgi:magnesium-transporting ATPase (P-type)